MSSRKKYEDMYDENGNEKTDPCNHGGCVFATPAEAREAACYDYMTAGGRPISETELFINGKTPADIQAELMEDDWNISGSESEQISAIEATLKKIKGERPGSA